jgi:hypothetical protein
MRRVLEHPLAPAVGCALAGLAYLAAAPATADMAGHAYRTWLYEHEGLTVWNAQWYGGHHVLGYSLLYAPLAALLGTALVGVAAAVAAVAAFSPLAREATSSPGRAAAACWLFAAGVLSNVVIGRMPFVLGIALAVGAWLCGRRMGTRAWGVAAAALALGAVLASPVAGAFLLLAAVTTAFAGGRAASWRAAVLALPTLAGGLALLLLFPEGGTDRFVASAFWPMLALSAGGVALLAPASRSLRLGGMLYLGVLVAAFFVPSAFGQNALRLPVLLGPPLLALAHRRRAPGIALAVVGVGLLYLQWLPAVRAVAEAHGDPSTRAAFHADAKRFLERVVKPGERVEVAFTRNHWEAADLAQSFALARGWERQLDQKANPIFYRPAPITRAAYHAWLRDNAVRWVALPNAPLDYSAQDEARLLRRGAPFLRSVYRSPRWRIWEVRDTEPPASGGARVLAVGPTWFEVDTTRPTVVRQRYTPYWYASGACVRRARGGWTEVDPTGQGDDDGVLLVRARFELGRAERSRCAG